MDSRIYMLVHKELTGELTPSEAEELHSLSAEEGGSDLTQDVSLIWNVSKEYFPKQDWNKGSAKAQFLNRIKADKTAKPTAAHQAQTVPSTSSIKMWKVGAGLLLIAALVFLAVKYFPLNSAANTEAPIEIKATDAIEYATLDDNTQIWLSPGSSIENVSMASTSRSVSLNGEAFFDVAHDPSRAFTINLGEDVNIEVLGTSFKASSSDPAGKGMVSVRDGIVRLYSAVGEKYEILTAGQTGELNARENHSVKFNTSEVLSLGNIGDLSLKKLPLDKVFEKLSDYYGVKIQNASGAVLDCTFNSPLTGEPTIDEVIEIISAVYPNLSFELRNRSTYSVSGSCK